MPSKKDNKKAGYGTVSLPLPLIDKIKSKMKGTGINSVSGYVAFIMRQVLSSSADESQAPMDKETEEALRKRLKALGYL